MAATYRIATVGHWLARYTQTDIERIPALGLASAWHALTVGDIGTVRRRIDALEPKGDERLEDGTPVSAPLSLIHAMTRADGLSARRDYAARAFRELPPASPLRLIACYLEGSAAADLGDLAAAKDRLNETIALSSALAPAMHAQCLCQLARIELAENNWSSADRLVDQMMRIMDEHGLHGRPNLCACDAVASVVHLHRGETALGNEERAQAAVLLERARDVSPYQTLSVRLYLARAAIMAGDLDEARSFLGDAERRLSELPETGTIDATAAAVRSMLDAASSSKTHLVEPITQAELRVLAYLPTHRSFGEIGSALYVSRNTVKSHAMAIYRKLGVASRSEAVVEARRIGLIAHDAVSTQT